MEPNWLNFFSIYLVSSKKAILVGTGKSVTEQKETPIYDPLRFEQKGSEMKKGPSWDHS